MRTIIVIVVTTCKSELDRSGLNLGKGRELQLG